MRKALARWWRSTTAIATLFRLRAATRRRREAEDRFIHARAILDASVPSHHANRDGWREAREVLKAEAVVLEADWLKRMSEEAVLARQLHQIHAGVAL